MTTSSLEGDFAITRKRKRQTAVDPCLGFYSTAISSTPPFFPELPVLSTSAIADLPEWTLLPKDQTPNKSDVTSPDKQTPSSEHVSVEAFLQNNSRRIHVKKYGRRFRNRRIIQSSSSPPPSDHDCVDQLDSDDRPHTRSSLDNADLCDLDEPAAKPAQELSRPALRFLPIKHPDNAGQIKQKPKRIRLWNTTRSKTGVPFRTSSFSGSNRHEKPKVNFGPHSETRKQHPINTWNSFGATTRGQNESSTKRSNLTVTRKRCRCAPLVFVPLADAEKSHTNSKKSRANFNSTNALPATKGPTIVPLTLVPVASTTVTPLGQIKPPLPLCTCASSSPVSTLPVAFPPTVEPSPIPGSTVLQDVNIAAPANLDAFFARPSQLGPNVAPSSTNDRSSSKHLKPLGSFLPGFLERARTAIHNEAASNPPFEYQRLDLSMNQPPGSPDDVSSPADPAVHSTLGLKIDERTAYPHTDGRRPTGSQSDRRHQYDQESTLSVDCAENGSSINVGGRLQDNSSAYLLDINGSPSTTQPEFAPYIPPTTPFDINAALLLYTQAGNSCIPLGSPGPRS